MAQDYQQLYELCMAQDYQQLYELCMAQDYQQSLRSYKLSGFKDKSNEKEEIETQYSLKVVITNK